LGRTIGDFDFLQASICKKFNLVIVTHNVRHYEDIVEYEDWVT